MGKLAISGGRKLVQDDLMHQWPIAGREEEEALLNVLRSGKWWRGAYQDPSESQVGQFEEAFAAYHDAKYGLAVSNGTVALECALRAAGIKAGDEVLVPALTFVASATSIAYIGAIPVFVDVDRETFNISADAMEAAVTPKTKAAVVVHNGGYPVDMDAVKAVAKKHNLKIIEDSAHAHGTSWSGTKVGAIGDIGTFSFQMAKTLTSGEGGMIVSNDEKLAEKAFSIHHIGRIKGRPFYEFHHIGSNLRMTEWQGAILNCQFARFPAQIKQQEANANYLASRLEEIDGVDPIQRDKRVTSWGFYFWNFHYHQDQFQNIPREKFIEALTAEGLPVIIGAHGDPIYNNPVFQNMRDIDGQKVDYTKVHCENAEFLYQYEALSFRHALFIGDKKKMDIVADVIKKVRDNADELRA